MAGAISDTSDTSCNPYTGSMMLDKDGNVSQRSTMISRFDSIEGRYIINRSNAILESRIEGPSCSIDHEEGLFEFIKRQETLLQRLEARHTKISDLDRDIRALAEVYKFRRPEEVYAFLRKDPTAIALILEAQRRIREHFSEEEIFMEVLTDPSLPDEKELLISISTSLPPDEAIRRLDAFDEDWWLGALTNSTADICIKVEYR